MTGRVWEWRLSKWEKKKRISAPVDGKTSDIVSYEGQVLFASMMSHSSYANTIEK